MGSIHYTPPASGGGGGSDIVSRIITADFVWSSTILATINGGGVSMSVPVEDGKTYIFSANLRATVQSDGADIVAQATAPAGSTGWFELSQIERAITITRDINATTSALQLGTNTDDTTYIKGVLQAVGDGNLEIQVANNAGTNSQTFGENSFLEVREVV